MTQIIAARNTCFGLISAIETDIRIGIELTSNIAAQQDLLPSDVRENAARRWQLDHQNSPLAEQPKNDFDLLSYTDFQDLSKVLLSRIATFLPNDKTWLTQVAEDLIALTGTRNRVCHSRPLEPEDFPACFDLANRLASSHGPINFSNVTATLKRIADDPGHVLAIQIPIYWRLGTTSIHHNLPLPEFDETGFLGRVADRQQVGRLLRSHYPVVSIVGEGGIGKTALALRCAYDLLDDATSPYDAIVWTTLKTSMLTQGGMREIASAIGNTLGLLSNMAEHLGTPRALATSLPLEKLVAEIVEYMQQFRVLAIIDNVETIGGTSLRDLLVSIPSTSKIMLTSRIGLGEFEARFPLGGLDPATSLALLRRFSRVLQIPALLRASEQVLSRYCEQLFENPLLIKWFVAGVARGLDPTALLNRKAKHFTEAIDFCFSTLFDNLTPDERMVVHTLASARTPLSAAELHYLNEEIRSDAVNWALSSLHNSSIVSRTQLENDSFTYTLSESATAFVSERRPPDKQTFARVQQRMRMLRVLLEAEAVRQTRFRYEIFSVRAGKTKEDKISTVYLLRALKCLQDEEFEVARKEIDMARRLAPSNPEVMRMAGLVESRAGEPYKAFTNFVQATELDPASAIAHYTLAQFHIRETDDYASALVSIEAAEALDVDEPTLATAKALILMRLGRYSDAATLYAKLFATIRERPLRWRISTSDQFAECLRRWGEATDAERDFPEGAGHFSQSLRVLRSALTSGDFDEQFPRRVDRVLSSLARSSRYVDRVDLIAEAIDLIDAFEAKSPGVRVSLPTCVEYQQYFPDETRVLIAQRFTPMVALLPTSAVQQTDSPVAAQTARHLGVVHAVLSQQRYGFIADTDGVRYFFHRNHLADQIDWIHLSVGMQVSFDIGRNDHGECAVNVNLTKHFGGQ